MLALISLILLLGSILLICFYNEIVTINSIKKINNIPVYEMNYKGNHGFDKYIKTGSKNYVEYVDFINMNLLKGIPNYYYKNFECSTFFAKTPDGDYILARNYDTTVSIPFVLKTNSENNGKTIGMADLHRVGWSESNMISKLKALAAPYYTFDGMNEKGVAIGALSVIDGSSSDTNDNNITLYDYAVIRLVMEKAENVEDAIKQLSQYNIKMEDKYPSHYMIADVSGECVVIDFVDGSMQVVVKEGNYQVATNMLSYNNDKHVGYSSDRYKAIEAVLSEKDGIITIEEAFELLEANTTPGQAKWSSVYNLSDNTMHVEFYGDYENTYTFAIKK